MNKQILSEEFFRMQKLAGLITENEYRNLSNIIQYTQAVLLLETESSAPPVDDLVKKVANTGADIKDEEIQLDILDKIIDSDFQPEKIDPKQIKEYKKFLEEEAGTLAVGIEILETTEVIEKFAEILGVNVDTIKKAVAWVKKIFGWPSKIIKKFFFTIARFFGASIESAEKWGIGGLAVIATICLVYGIMHFPGLIATLSGGFGFMALAKLGWGLIKSAAGLKALWQKFKSYKKESDVKIYTTNDFLTSIESKYKEITNKKIPNDWVFTLKDYFSEIKDEETQEKVSEYFERISYAINTNRRYNLIGLIKLIEKNPPIIGNNDKILNIFKEIANIFKLN